MAQGASLGHRRYVALEDVQIRSTDGGRVDLDNGIGRPLDLRIRFRFPVFLPWSVIDESFHIRTSSLRPACPTPGLRSGQGGRRRPGEGVRRYSPRRATIVFRCPAIVAKERSAREGPSPRYSMTRVPHPLAINADFVRAGRMRIAAASFANAEAPRGFFAMTVSCHRERRIDWTPHRHTHDRHPAG